MITKNKNNHVFCSEKVPHIQLTTYVSFCGERQSQVYQKRESSFYLSRRRSFFSIPYQTKGKHQNLDQSPTLKYIQARLKRFCGSYKGQCRALVPHPPARAVKAQAERRGVCLCLRILYNLSGVLRFVLNICLEVTWDARHHIIFAYYSAISDHLITGRHDKKHIYVPLFLFLLLLVYRRLLVTNIQCYGTKQKAEDVSV